LVGFFCNDVLEEFLGGLLLLLVLFNMAIKLGLEFNTVFFEFSAVSPELSLETVQPLRHLALIVSPEYLFYFGLRLFMPDRIQLFLDGLLHFVLLCFLRFPETTCLR
jgi:hypothetical protein